MFDVFFTYIFGVLFIFFASIRFVHILQLESYQNKMFGKWIIANSMKGDLLIVNCVSLLLSLLTAIGFYGI